MRSVINLGLLCFGVCLLGASAAFAGSESGNGGDGCAANFVGIAQRTAKTLTMICATYGEKSACRVLNPLLAAIATTSVTAEDAVFGPDQKERDAVNNGQDKIAVSRIRWNTTRINPDAAERWVRVVIHEYLSVAKVESSDSYPDTEGVVALFKDVSIDINAVVGVMPADFPAQTAGGYKIENKFVNSDGSVTLVHPKFIFQNRDVDINARSSAGYYDILATSMATHICRAFNLGEQVFNRTERVKMGESREVAFFQCRGSGGCPQFTGTEVVERGGWFHVSDSTYFAEITCGP